MGNVKLKLIVEHTGFFEGSIIAEGLYQLNSRMDIKNIHPSEKYIIRKNREYSGDQMVFGNRYLVEGFLKMNNKYKMELEVTSTQKYNSNVLKTLNIIP